MGGTGRRVAAAYVLLLLPALAACDVDGGAATAVRGAASATPGTDVADDESYDPSDDDAAAITALLEERARAVLRGDEQGFLATVDPTRKRFVASQRVLFRNLTRLELTVLDYDVDTSDYLLPADVPGDDPLLNPIVVEHVQVRETLRSPVTNQVDLTFVRRGPDWLIGAEQGPGDEEAFGRAQERPWFGGPIAVRRDGGITVLVDRDRSDELGGLVSTVRSGIARDAELLGKRGDDRLLVDATSNGEPVDFSHVNKAEAAAVTQPLVGFDLDGALTGLAGTVVKMNPDSVAEVLEDERILWHELAHHLLQEHNGAAPTWLSEGIASWTQWQPYEMAQLVVPGRLRSRILAQDHTLPIVGLFKTDPSANYLIAQAAVEWLVDRGGAAKVVELMAAYDRAYDGPNTDAHTARLVKKLYGVTERALADGAWERLAQLQSG